MKKGVKRMIIIIPCLVVLVGAVLIYYFGAKYPMFYKNSSKEFVIPGLDEKFVPQGLEYVAAHNVFLLNGYMSDGLPSRIYVIDKISGNAIKYVTLISSSRDYTGHAGGIASKGDMVWISGDGRVETIALSTLMNANNGDAITISKTITTGNGADFLWVNDNILWVGEFYHKSAYKTIESHHVKLKDGSYNYALGLGFNIDGLSESGLEESPTYALSLPEKVQGITKTKSGEIFVSSSYSIPSSKFCTYKNIFESNATQSISFNGKELPLFVLSSDVKTNELMGPAMAEEVALCDGRVYILFESACHKYKFVNRTRLKNVYSLEI